MAECLQCPYVQVAALEKGSFPLALPLFWENHKQRERLSLRSDYETVESYHSDQCGFLCVLHHYDRCTPLTTSIYLWGVSNGLAWSHGGLCISLVWGKTQC